MAETKPQKRQQRSLRLRYVDITEGDGPPGPHQEVVRAFEELGYRQAGLVRIEVESGGFEVIADDYAPQERGEMLEHLPEPHTLLLSADGLVVARVGWFWSWPGVELHTFMDDGARVETQRRWAEVPPWPAKRQSLRRFATVEGEMTRQAARGRSIVVVDGADARRLDEAHRAHVSAYGDVHACAPAPAPGRADLLRLSEHAHLHAQEVAHSYARVGNVVLFSLVLAMVVGFLYLVHLLRSPWWGLFFAAVMFALTALGPLGWFAVRFAYTRWWRPAYRAPAT